MKALYLLLGLLLLITISSAPPTPFLIGGWVIDSDGNPVNISNVTITNLNKSEVYTAETIADSNYYQHVLDNISAGDVLEFNTTDGTRSNITKHDVVAEEIGNGTIFPFNITLAEAGLTPTPQIIGYAPDSPVHDTGNATRTFNITVDQVVNVTWLINGTEDFNETNVNESFYTNTSADIGVWNVSAIVSNGNKTAMQKWVWNVTTLLPPNIISFAPLSPVYDIRNATRTFNITVNQVVDVIWLINGIEDFNETNVNESFYTNTSADIGVWNVSAIVSNGNKTAMQKWVWNVTTLLPPNIISFAPLSPVYDIRNATRTFNITVDQVVDVIWLINGTEDFNEPNVNESSYTNTSAAIGVWNVSGRVSNGNGTARQEWVWYVAPPSSATSQPAVPFVVCGWMNYEGDSGVYDNHTVNITNHNTGTVWQAETQAGCNYYELIINSGDVGTGNVFELEIADGVGYNTTNYTVTDDDLDKGGFFNFTLMLPVLAPLVDVELTPDDDQTTPGVQVINYDYLTTNRTVTITANVTDPDDYKNITSVTADITGVGTVGDSPVSLTFISNSSATTARYTGRFNMASHPVGDYAVVVKATNVKGFTGTSSKSFTYLYEAPAFIPPSPFIIYGSISYDNNSACDSPFVVVTNLNTSKELIADNRTGESFYQLVTSCAFANEGNVLRINASKNGSPVGNVTHTVNQTNIDKGVIEANINEADLPDFTVTEISFNPSEPFIGDLVTINATIANSGAADGKAFVELYDNKSISIASDDTITLPDILRIRVHFMAFCVLSGGNITIYNETQLVEELPITEMGKNYWTKWCDGETIRIESSNAWFIVDRYEAVLANKIITLGAGNSTSIPAVWNLSDQYMGCVTSGTHAITVRVDPYDQLIESNETNNERNEAIDVNPSLDFAVTNISFNDNKPVLGDVVGIDATIHNYGVRDGTTIVEVCYYNTSAAYNIPLVNKTIALNGTESKVVSAFWQTGAAYGGVGNHTITVKLTSDALVEANETNNTLKKQLFVNGTDLTVTAIEIPCGFDLDNNCYPGQGVPVTATIKNIGSMYATNFTVRFRDDAKTGECTFNETHIERLNSSETMYVPVVWNPNETGEHTITVNISYDKYTENDGMNNELSDNPFVESKYDFLVESVNVTPQEAVRRGESVNITATIGNIGHVEENVSIAFFVNSTDFAGTCEERFIRIKTLDNVYVKVGENKTVSITWDVDVAGGSHLIAAVVNPDNEIEEPGGGTIYEWEGGLIRFRGNKTGNNVKNCTLHVIPNDLNITDLTLDPHEPNICEVVDISAAIENNRTADAESTVRFYMEHNVSHPMYMGSSWSTHQQPEDVMIRVHFNYIKYGFGGYGDNIIHPGYWIGNVTAYVNDSLGQRKQIYFYFKNEDGEMEKVPHIDRFMSCTESMVSGGLEGRHWYDVWTEWSYGDKIEISLPTKKTRPGWISIDCYQVRLGNETVTLRPGESMVYPGTWNASPSIRAGEYYRLMASVDDQKMYSEDTYLGGTDLAVTNISVTPVALDGNRVWINATIESLGMMDAADFLVNVSEVYRPEDIGEDERWEGERRNAADNIELLNTTHAKGLEVGNSIHISVLWNASIREIGCQGDCKDDNDDIIPCSWTEIADDYIINITINPLESTEKEENNTNNTRVADVHVDSSRDFEVTNLSFLVNNESRDPSELLVNDDLTLNTTLMITNFLNKGGSVNVSFYIDETCDEHEIGNTTVVFPAGNATSYAEIEWKVANFDCVDIPGDHNMTVVVDPENRIYEINESNNVSIHPIHVRASDILVEKIEINPESPVRGETASINVTLRNHGGADANGLILNIYDWAERHIEDANRECGVGCEQMVITRDNATAMRLYLDLEVEDGGRVCIKDNNSGREIVCYHKNFHGWTPWVLDNSTAIVVTDSAYARVSKVYYIESSGIINTSTHDIEVNKTKKITVDWNASMVGERFIAAIVDPEDSITESNESNNRLVEFTSVQTADLLVSNLSLAWFNGTEIGKNDTIEHGDDVRISANLSNIGVEDASSFKVRFFVDDLLINEEIVSGLAYGSTISRFTDWSATVVSHLIKIEVDNENRIDETNETNNIVYCEPYVRGPELLGNTSWETLGLHGEILFEPDQPYDEDKVNITATINNSGYMPAENFSAALFFDYKPSWYRLVIEKGGEGREEREYAGAVCVYLDIVINSSDLTLTIYDGDGNEIKKTDRSCWVRVPGDVVDVSLHAALYGDHKIFSYPVYLDNLSQIKELGVNSSVELPPITHNVSARDYPIMLFIDPEGKVPEDKDQRADNIMSRIMRVKPTRDFIVTNITAARTNLSDLDTPTITADVANIGLRNGTAEVTFVDYEEKDRTYKYYFDPNLTLSYLPIPPYAGLLKSGYDGLTIIHCPGVDAIEDLCFEVDFEPKTSWDIISSVYDENDDEIWSATGSSFGGRANASIPLVSGETAYIYTYQASFEPGGYPTYTTKKEFHSEKVRLNATREWNESKNVTPTWNASTGNHTIAVTLHSDDEITEIDESNNEKSSLFSVNASREPVIVELNFTPEHPDDGDDVDITAVIANNGSKNVSFTFDLWANTTQDKGGPDVTDPNLTVDLGDRIRYIKLLNHSDLTLAPGENMTIKETWNDISGFGLPRHRIIAIVDPLDEIDEANESNNEIDREIFMNYPDFTIGGCNVPGGKDKVAVIIEEIGGACGAPDVTVRFVACEEKKCKGCGCYGVYGPIRESGAANIQVHFDHLNAMNGHVYVRDSTNLRKKIIKTYSGVQFDDKWGPWVNGSEVYIFCQGAGTYAEIDKYRWGNVSDNQTGEFDAGGHEDVEIPWTDYREPYDLTIIVDPDNNITELNEDNNNKTVLMYADLGADNINFSSPSTDKLSLDAEWFKIDGIITNKGDKVGTIFPVSDFNVTLEFRNKYPNGTVGDLVFNMTKHIEDPLCADKEMPILFEFNPSEELEVGGNYTVFLMVDSSGDICESNELYPDGEDNNAKSVDIFVHNTSGYTGGGELINVAQGEVNGRVVYTVGDNGSCELSGMMPTGGEKTVTYTGVVPDDAGGIEFARLFVYWYTWVPGNPVLAGIDATFNGHSLTMAGNYSDNPGATIYDTGYGLYSYDVAKYVTKGENEATVKITSDWDVGIHAIGLLVVYEDDDEPLTKYWVNEGADIVMAANDVYKTGLADGDCITTALFEGVEQEDEENVNASLLTVLGFYVAYGKSSYDALEFNDQSIGSIIHSGKISGNWEHHYRETGIALTKNEWEDVTDHLKYGDNIADIQSLGNFMMPNNAFLRLIFPPDLAVTDIDTPISAVVGNKYAINTTISNEGRSDATDFNVSFYSNKVMIGREKISRLDSGDNITLQFNWKPMHVGKIYKIKVAADVVSGQDWIEPDIDNNEMIKKVPIVASGYGNESGPIGEGGSGTGGTGDGGEGSVSLFDAITGILMKGSILDDGEGGGGGIGEFSLLEWLMKGFILAICSMLIFFGFLMEKRRYNKR